MAMCKEGEEVIFSLFNVSKTVEKSSQIKIHIEKRMSYSFFFFFFWLLTLPPIRDNVMQFGFKVIFPHVMLFISWHKILSYTNVVSGITVLDNIDGINLSCLFLEAYMSSLPWSRQKSNNKKNSMTVLNSEV